MSDRDDVENLLRNHKRRLQKLRESQALLGVDTPPQIVIEIEDIETEIEKLQSMSFNKRSSIAPSIIRRELSDVIIIHDDLNFAELLASVVRDIDLKPSITYNFQTALSLIERYQPRTVISDVWYVKTGELTIELAAQFKDFCPGIKILGMSAGYKDIKLATQIFDRIFSKPVRIDDIIDELLS